MMGNDELNDGILSLRQQRRTCAAFFSLLPPQSMERIEAHIIDAGTPRWQIRGDECTVEDGDGQVRFVTASWERHGPPRRPKRGRNDPPGTRLSALFPHLVARKSPY
jgi:hypothetical protein